MPANREREGARRELAELERRAAPEYIREIVRARAELREVVLRDLDAGRLPSLGTALDVAARASLGLYEPYRQGWLADPRRREVAGEWASLGGRRVHRVSASGRRPEDGRHELGAVPRSPRPEEAALRDRNPEERGAEDATSPALPGWEHRRQRALTEVRAP
jgi:hypothetical protein